MPVRQKEIAEAANVSITTVSLALAGHPRISLKTRKRVQKVARDLGYRPDLAARALRQSPRASSTGKFLGTLAAVVPQRLLQTTPQQQWEAEIALYREEAMTLGYRLDTFSVPDEAVRLREIDRVLRNRGVVGLILWAGNRRRRWELDWRRYGVVAISWPAPCPFHAVGGDRFKSLQDIVGRVLAQGYRRPGLIHPGEGFEGWVGGFVAGLQKAGMEQSAVPSLEMKGWDETLALEWWQRHRPDVIIANHGTTLPQAFLAAGVRVPEVVAYCSPDVLEDAPGVAGLRQPRAGVARLAIELLHGQLRRHETGAPTEPMTISLEARWLDGGTLPPRVPRER